MTLSWPVYLICLFTLKLKQIGVSWNKRWDWGFPWLQALTPCPSLPRRLLERGEVTWLMALLHYVAQFLTKKVLHGKILNFYVNMWDLLVKVDLCRLHTQGIQTDQCSLLTRTPLSSFPSYKKRYLILKVEGWLLFWGHRHKSSETDVHSGAWTNARIPMA